MLVKNEVILAKVEGTYGVDSSPVAATDAILVQNIGWSNEGMRMNERPVIKGSLGTLQHVYGGRLMSLTFDVEIKGSGAAGTAPELGVLLEGCAMGETVVPATSVAYSPISDNQDSLTLYYYQDGLLYILVGCRGNFSLNLEAGALGMLSFTFTGHVGSITDTALVSPTVSAVVPEAVLSATFAVGGFAAVVNALSLDISNTIATAPTIAASDGFGEVQVTARDPNGSVDPEAELLAAYDPIDDMVNGVALAMSATGIGGTAGNIYGISIPAAAYRDVTPGDREGIRTYEVPFGAAEVSGDDDFTLTFT